MFTPASAIADWRDLQAKVAELFREMGYEAFVERPVQLGARGQKEVDVYIRDDRASVNQIMLVECKLWEKPVPQAEVHGMLTIMHESGANTGFIISKAGFQSGAHEAARFTNIHLLTWEELQQTFGRQWLQYQKAQIAPLVAKMRIIDQTHLDQMSPAPYHNNMFYPGERWEDLFELLLRIRLVILADLKPIPRFDVPGPFVVRVYSGFPGAIRSARGEYELSLSDVRAYYRWFKSTAEALIAEYDKMSQSAHESFEALPDETKNRAFGKAVEEMRGDTPIRVFKPFLGDEAYAALLKRLDPIWKTADDLPPE